MAEPPAYDPQRPFATRLVANAPYDLDTHQWRRIPTHMDDFGVILLRLNTPYRAERAVAVSAMAAWIFAVLHLFSALFVYWRPPGVTVLSDDPSALLMLQFAGAALAGTLAVAMKASQARWPHGVLLAWSALCLLGGGYSLYGYRAWIQPSALVILFAVTGLRGALALRRLERDQPPA
jgi:hypothetical protein